MLHRIQLVRRFDGVELIVDGKTVPLGPSLAIRNHSPTGFEWGYGGSGPAQTALAILLATIGARDSDAMWPGGDAERNYQTFKWDYVAVWPRDVDVDVEVDVDAWLADRKVDEVDV